MLTFTNNGFSLKQHEKRTGFISPDRPKEWRKLVMDVLWESVLIRIESSKLEERNTNKLWLFKNLEIARQFILEDLRVVKTLCVPCFPPEYDIFNEYIKMYHIILSKHVMFDSFILFIKSKSNLTFFNVFLR